MATTSERGYGTDHQAKRALEQLTVDAGHAKCWRCKKPIRPGDEWHLGHDDHDRNIYRGIECVPCNTKAGGKQGALVTNTRRTMTTREW